MKSAMRFTVMAVLLAFFAAAFVGEAQAKPSWVSVKYKTAKLIVQKGKKDTDKNYLRLELTFGITNNSKSGDIITAIYDKKIGWSGVLIAADYGGKPGFSIGYKGDFPTPNKGEWYPGQTYDYKTSVPLGLIISDNTVKESRLGHWHAFNKSLLRKFGFKMNKFFLDFQVRSKK